MNFEDVVLIGSVRETVRSHLLTVGNAEIRDCIESWRSGKPWQRPAETPPAANGPELVCTPKDPILRFDFSSGCRFGAPRGDSAKPDGAPNCTEPADIPKDPIPQPTLGWGLFGAIPGDSAKPDGAANCTEPTDIPKDPIPQPSLGWVFNSAKLDGATNSTEPAAIPKDPLPQPSPFFGFNSSKLDGAANRTEPADIPKDPLPQPSLGWGSFRATPGDDAKRKNKKGKEKFAPSNDVDKSVIQAAKIVATASVDVPNGGWGRE